jgi:hypothetical protein
MRNHMFNFTDATQQSFGFLRQQLSIIEPGVYRTVFPEVQYPGLVPVTTDGWEWAKSVTFTSMNSVGRAQWFHSQARDVPVTDVTLDQFETRIEMAAIGYRYGIEEVQTALRLGVGIDNEKAMAAKRAYEEFVDDVVLRGNTTKGWAGLINQVSDVTTIDAADVGNQNGGTNSSYWEHKTPAQVMDDFNIALTNVYQESLQVEMADTVLLPLTEMTRLAQMQMPNLPTTVLEWVQRHNMYTLQTNRPLNIKAVRGLESADDAGGGRMVVYRNDPGVLKFHLPMPHRFLPVQPENPVGLVFLVPGIFRLGGLEIRRPKAMRYVDGISPVPV